MRRRATLAALPLLLLGACAAGGSAPAQPVRVVFFEDDSVSLGAAALNIVQETARTAVANPALPVRVLGFIAPEPGQTPTMALARARAEHVANELVRFGVPRERIQVRGRGPVAFADAPVESRRVEIHLGGA